MIIKGSARGQSAADTAALSRHLLAKENEQVEILEIQGVTATALHAALEEMRMVTMGSRARRALYHASVSLDREEAPTMTKGRWRKSADELGERLGMQGHQRVVVLHIKKGREHVHVVWCRVHPQTLRLARDSQNYRKHEECSRFLEERWGLRQVVGVHTRTPGTPRPVAVGTHDDWQAAERTGIAVRDVAAALREAWSTTTVGKQFADSIEREGFQLARGRRGVVVMDGAGTPHSIPRRLQLKAAVVQKRLASLDTTKMPTVEDIKTALRRQRRNTMSMENKGNTEFGAADAKQKRGHRPAKRAELNPGYWIALGLEVDELSDAIRVKLPGGAILWDRGDRLTLSRAGEPTDDEIRILVAAGKARGWQEIRLTGGSTEWQRRARLEALRQGYRLDQVSLECEDGDPKQLAAQPMPMPEHVRRKLLPPLPPSPVRQRPSKSSSGQQTADMPTHPSPGGRP